MQRVGETIVRPLGAWSATVHALLNHLEEKGFSFSPRVLELDAERGVEVLTYLEGECKSRLLLS